MWLIKAEEYQGLHQLPSLLSPVLITTVQSCRAVVPAPSISSVRFIKLKALMSAQTGLPALHGSPGSHVLNGLMGLSWTFFTIDQQCP